MHDVWAGRRLLRPDRTEKVNVFAVFLCSCEREYESERRGLGYDFLCANPGA